MTNMIPNLEDFAATAKSGESQLLYTKLVLDLETPVSAMLKLADRYDGPKFLLESVEGGESRGRYSIIGLEPDMLWRCFGNRSEVSHTAPFTEDSFEPSWEDSLTSLRKWVESVQLEMPEGLPPMAAGLIGHMGYDMVKLMERLPDENPDEINIPDACFMRPTLLLIFDAVDGVVYVIAPIWKEALAKGDAKALYGAARQRIERIGNILQGPIDQRHYYRDEQIEPLDFTSNTDQETYHGMIAKAKEYIASGDIFQVVLGQRLSADFDASPFSLYRSLRYLNPSPFLFYLEFGGYTLVGSSPEILVRLRDETVTIRPIAGTRWRGKTPAEDAALAEDLLSDEKECAEHLMLLDLGRNDVGRIAAPNSVTVTDQMIVERYSHVMHIVSNVEGTLAEGKDAIDALVAGFPAGTVSGAPKIRAMEIIEELEPTKRSFYAGCVGYFSGNGSMDTCIALRTALVKDGKIYVQAGGGVVADSDPEAERQESLNKAKAVMEAARMAKRFG